MKKLAICVLLIIMAVMLTACCEHNFHIGQNGNLWDGDKDLGVQIQGVQGPQGEQGIQGEQGPQGEQGIQGESGIQGPQGAQGEQGPQGPQGEQGIQGEQGVQGPQGIQGPQGEQGIQGVQGVPGNSPYIGTNGNWWVGDVDTGIPTNEVNMDRKGTDGLLFRTTICGGYAGYEVYGYVGTDTDIVVPNFIFDQPVISIIQDALPKSVTSISISSNTLSLPQFKSYGNLGEFDFNNAPVDTTTESMFYGCENLSVVKNYGQIRVISKETFRQTKIMLDYDFSNVESVGQNAFNDYVFDKNSIILNGRGFVYLPECVKTVEANAFDSDIAVYYANESCDFTSTLLHKNVKYSNGFYYQPNGLEATVVNYDGNDDEIKVPSILGGKVVTSVANYAFYTNPYIRRVEFSSSIKAIGYRTFAYCKNLYGIFVPDSVETVGDFDDMHIYNSAEFEKPTVFFEAEELNFTNGVTSPEQLDIDKYVLGVKPDDVIEDDVCVYVKRTLSYDVVTIKRATGVVTIPAYVNGLPVSRINKYAMLGASNITKVNISSGIDKISSYAFYGNSNLLYVNVPKSVDVVNYQGFASLSNCIIHIEAKTKPSEWDSSWYSSIKGYVMNSQVKYDETGTYVYEIVDGKVYLNKYLLPITTQTTIFIPEKIDGKEVYGVRSYCYKSSVSNYSSDRFVFVIPDTITVMESYAINMYSYGYSYIYLEFDSASDIPETWDSKWCYSTSGYGSYATKYYSDQWELEDGNPVSKQ